MLTPAATYEGTGRQHLPVAKRLFVIETVDDTADLLKFASLGTDDPGFFCCSYHL